MNKKLQPNGGLPPLPTCEDCAHSIRKKGMQDRRIQSDPRAPSSDQGETPGIVRPGYVYSDCPSPMYFLCILVAFCNVLEKLRPIHFGLLLRHLGHPRSSQRLCTAQWTSSLFCRAAYLEHEAKRIFRELEQEPYLKQAADCADRGIRARHDRGGDRASGRSEQDVAQARADRAFCRINILNGRQAFTALFALLAVQLAR